MVTCHGRAIQPKGAPIRHLEPELGVGKQLIQLDTINNLFEK